MTKLNVNGQIREVETNEDMPLLWFLRDELGLKGTKFGCGMAMCGACKVHLNGKPIRSCVTSVESVAGGHIETIEAATSRQVQAIQSAWTELSVPQCGYCQSGQIMSAAALLAENAVPTNEEIDAAMAGNICRCGTYNRIRQGIHMAAKSLKE